MRIFSNPAEAVKEVERDVYEMGILTHPQTMQDKDVKDDPEYTTKEVRGYSFKINGWDYNFDDILKVIEYFFPDQIDAISLYCLDEIQDRMSGVALNPGNAYKHRLGVWNEFLHDGKFAYTYSERMHQQVQAILYELKERPDTRQGIITIHSNICPFNRISKNQVHNVQLSADFDNKGGGGRIPCSMYYQLMIREDKLDLVYTMRSCDLLTHFPIDISLALMTQQWFASRLNLPMGTFTYFTGSLHAYFKDIKNRGVF